MPTYSPKKRVYVAGPMRGRPGFNFPAFDAAAERLRNLGFEVCNPADRDRQAHGPDVNASPTGDLADIEHTGFSLREALGFDMDWIARHADAVAVLPGWEASKGAQAEVALARALGLVVAPVEAFTTNALPTESVPATGSGEVRVTSTTGGQKGSKPARYDLLPSVPLEQLARLYGRGAQKYAAHNWAKGYDWSLSFAALQRHAWAFWSGEDTDEEMGLPHMTAVAFHAFALVHFLTYPEYARFDDRYRGPEAP